MPASFHRKTLLSRRSRSAGLTSLLVLSLLGSVSPRAQAFESADRALPQLARDAGAIFVGTVVGSRARYGDASRRWIVTDYSIRVEERLDGAAAAREVTVTYWGGTLGGRTQRIAGLSYPAAEERYVFFLRPQTPTAGVPVVGGDQGLLRVSREAGVEFLRSAKGALLFEDAQRGLSDQPAAGARPLTLSALRGLLQQRLPEFRRLPADPPASPSPLGAFRRPATSAPARGPARVATDLPLAATGGDEPGLPPGPAAQPVTADPQKRSSAPGPILPGYAYGALPRAPIVISQLPPGGIAPEDQYAMSRWNYYTPGLFRVYQTPPTDWAWGNGVFDIAGFVDETTMQAQFGTTWAALGFIGVTFSTADGGVITEADVALNPGTSWTFDDEAVHDGSSDRVLRRTLTHEMGHVLGLDHQFNYVSIMNYPPNRFRSAVIPFMDDAAGARAAFPGNATPRTDLGVYLFRSTGYQAWSEATIPGSARIGATITINDYHLENAGTTRVDTPRVEWYLTSRRSFSSAYYYLGASTYSGLDPFHYFTPSSMAVSFRVPAGIPPGDYYLAAFIRGDGSPTTAAFQRDNNRSFSHNRITVTR